MNFDNRVLNVCALGKCNRVGNLVNHRNIENNREGFIFNFNTLEKISLHTLEKISVNYSSFYCYLNVFISLIFMHIQNPVLIDDNPVIKVDNPVLIVQSWRLIS